jgi:heterodisulfide reductase subunit C
MPMNHTPVAAEPGRTLAEVLERETGVRPAECYQCGKCSAGCPVAGEMDHPPSRLLRMLQLALPRHEEGILGSRTIWACVGCETCLTRCPQGIELPRVVDFLRQAALARGCAHPDSHALLAFHRAFLRSIEARGRLFELGMIAEYKLRTRRLLQDVPLAPAMYAKGKISLLPHAVRDRKAVARLFARARAMEERQHAGGDR